MGLKEVIILHTMMFLKFYGTPKLHGTNASIVFYKDGSTQIQSRNNILNQHQDNMDFYKWMNPERVAFYQKQHN